MNKNYISTIIRFSVNVPIAAVAIVLGTVLFLSFIVFPSIGSELIFFVSVLGGLCTLYSAFYIGRGLSLQYHQTVMKNSFELLSNVHTVERMRIRSKLEREFDPNKVAPDKLYNAISQDEHFDTAVRSLFNLYENISIAIQHGYVDERIIYDDLSFIIPHTCEVFMPYIHTIRKVKRSNIIYTEIVRLSNSWSDGKYLSTGKPISKNQTNP